MLVGNLFVALANFAGTNASVRHGIRVRRAAIVTTERNIEELQSRAFSLFVRNGQAPRTVALVDTRVKVL
jgi:hypothetical protein